ncbi:unnamed protein product [Cylicostephanus goldi]|uniref:Uncharacterized protein n=1 Tax=Cylicostephanus goldi TaxID=71465 RepID=A0A3P7MPK1_CYLGO|nr:unnamed protein product [Cylicostephanus goldi]
MLNANGQPFDVNFHAILKQVQDFDDRNIVYKEVPQLLNAVRIIRVMAIIMGKEAYPEEVWANLMARSDALHKNEVKVDRIQIYDFMRAIYGGNGENADHLLTSVQNFV